MTDLPDLPTTQPLQWPDPDLLDELLPGTGDVARQAEQVLLDTDLARQDLACYKPGGEAWATAANNDRAAAAQGDTLKKPALAAVMAQQPVLYARARALAEALPERLDDLRGRLAGREQLLTNVDARLTELRKQAGVAAHRAAGAAQSGDKPTAWPLLRDFDTAVAEARPLLGLRRWLVGEDTAYDPMPQLPLPRQTLDAVRDARDELDGVPDEQRRQSRTLAAMQRANFTARVENRDLPYPEVLGSQREQLASVRPLGGVS